MPTADGASLAYGAPPALERAAAARRDSRDPRRNRDSPDPRPGVPSMGKSGDGLGLPGAQGRGALRAPGQCPNNQMALILSPRLKNLTASFDGSARGWATSAAMPRGDAARRSLARHRRSVGDPVARKRGSLGGSATARGGKQFLSSTRTSAFRGWRLDRVDLLLSLLPQPWSRRDPQARPLLAHAVRLKASFCDRLGLEWP